MKLQLITDIKLIRKIHTEHLLNDFPENEATPWIYIKEMLRQGKYECYGAFRETAECAEKTGHAEAAGRSDPVGQTEGDFLGYAFFLKQELEGKKIYLFDYLAITEKYRNQGVGTEFIRLLGNSITAADVILGEVEDPLAAESEEDRALRERRLQFYQRNGYHLTGVRVRVRGVDYCLLEVPTSAAKFHTDEEVREIYTAIYSHVAPDWFMKKHFRILS